MYRDIGQDLHTLKIKTNQNLKNFIRIRIKYLFFLKDFLNVTPFGKTLCKLRIDHSERLLDMAKKLDISVSFLSSVEIGKKSVPVGLEEKIIELYALDQEKTLLLRKEAYV